MEEALQRLQMQSNCHIAFKRHQGVETPATVSQTEYKSLLLWLTVAGYDLRLGLRPRQSLKLFDLKPGLNRPGVAGAVI